MNDFLYKKLQYKSKLRYNKKILIFLFMSKVRRYLLHVYEIMNDQSVDAKNGYQRRKRRYHTKYKLLATWLIINVQSVDA